MGKKVKNVYRYDVFDNGKLFLENVTSATIVELLDLPAPVPARYSMSGETYRDRWTFVRLGMDGEGESTITFRRRYGIDPVVYDRAMREFRERGGAHLKKVFVPPVK